MIGPVPSIVSATRNRAVRGIFLGVAIMAASCLVGPTDGVAAGNVPAGREKAQLCAACHGVAGISSMPGVPNLAGNPDAFLQWQLVFFRSERRKNPVMLAIASQLSDEDVRNLGAFYASLPPDTRPVPADTDPALTKQGAEVAQERRCANCHTDNFAGKQGAARLARQHEDYIVKSLTDYRSNGRPSTGVAAMTEVASGLGDADIAALAHYLSRVP